ncbi:MAG: isopeptide-forming domain-containing fimbrial protein, partial [Thermoplasmatales archaeon]|nr:isopeptide-forming domain-containing fimbrial protein [Thermoplasmatales archaeon]
MLRKKISLISLITGLMMIVSTFSIGSSIIMNKEYPSIQDCQPDINVKGVLPGSEYPTGLTETYPINVSKTIWEGINWENPWVDSIHAEIGDTLRFNITITYTKSNDPDCTNSYKNTNIKIIDTLPSCLAYCADSTVIIHGNDVFTEDSSTSEKLIFWNLTEDYGIELYRENYYPNCPSYMVSILFNATVTDPTGVDGEQNKVNVTALEKCCSNNLEGSAEATIIVEEAPEEEPSINVKKFVRRDSYGDWEDDGITVDPDVCDWVEFKILVTNTGTVTLDMVTVRDELPSDIFYDDHAQVDGVPHEYDWKDGNDYYWNLSNVGAGETRIIEFRAIAIICDTNNSNLVNVTGEYCIGIFCPEYVYDEDTAYVKVVCEENPSIDLVKEADVDVAFVGDMITYTYTVTNTGDVTLIDVWVFDELLSEYAPLGVVELAPTETTSGVLTYVVQESDCPGPIVNTAVACGMFPSRNEVYDEDTATVTVYGCEFEPSLLEKKVWNESSDQWEESITAEIGDI